MPLSGLFVPLAARAGTSTRMALVWAGVVEQARRIAAGYDSRVTLRQRRGFSTGCARPG
ncbi:hypothetical protein GCM10010278_68110 [Streptomyces melanogenes]|nr:hypothetical protein GCM10010278_68110 [Streptomyces melanogenes]